MSISNSSVVTVRSPADLLTLVPYLLGFHPSDSLVLIAVADKRVRFAGRCDLPTPGADQTQLRDAVARMASLTARENATALLAGYGPAAQVTAALDPAIAAMTARGVQVGEALRVTDGRYFSYLCDNEDCCPSHGTAFDPTTSAVAAAVTVAGFVALPDRATLSTQVAPVDGAERQAMNRATERALMRLSEAAAAVEAATVPKDASALICQWGIDAVRRDWAALATEALAGQHNTP